MDINTQFHHERLDKIMEQAKLWSDTYKQIRGNKKTLEEVDALKPNKDISYNTGTGMFDATDMIVSKCDSYVKEATVHLEGIRQRDRELEDFMDGKHFEGKKFDEGKPALSILPVEALEEVAKVLSYGATKYGKNNYKGGFNRSRLIDAALRHLYADAAKIDLDDESNLMHLAHAAASILMLIQNIKTGVSTDDR
jgi:hypothetical protein